ncbi:MAG: hypothetical protein PUK66_07115 [Bacteroidales bacterium]|uniref:hypothetical protein n=1 Tax=Porphyromonas sp. TaxID=1924944 RepID=UPI0029746C58|nr:hypothetical protein [Porphyromonas sp.]MDD7438581.1 hypothetical protein [Bacteroidales bacterium]MDY3067837.1 hypothetical protein [Porphyromonas sp.]
MEIVREILPWMLTAIASVVSWFAGKKQADNDFLGNLQESIDLLSIKNKELLDEVVKLRIENAVLQSNQETLMQQLEDLRVESEAMREILKSMNIAIPRPRQRKSTTKKDE